MLHVAGPEAVRKATWAALEAARDALATHTKEQCARRCDNCAGDDDWAGVALAAVRVLPARDVAAGQEGKVYNWRREPLADKPGRLRGQSPGTSCCCQAERRATRRQPASREALLASGCLHVFWVRGK